MNSKELIRRVIEFDSPDRIGLDFNSPNQKDIAWIPAARLISSKYQHQADWGYYEDLLSQVPGFRGEVKRDAFGNIYGRLGEKTNGECIKGALQDGWNDLDVFEMPVYDKNYEDEILNTTKENENRFLLGVFPIAVFSTIRDIRRIDNALMDVLLEQNKVRAFLRIIEGLAVELADKAVNLGFDGMIMYDDWGDQNSLLISPRLWREIFKPVYASVVKAVHERGMKFFVHSCGNISEIISDFIDVGVDVLQMDQPEIVGVERLGRKFGGCITFWSPVDIQRIMPSGNRELIQKAAINMIQHLGKYRGGFIAKDYPVWEDIDIKDEWAAWAREIFVEHGKY